MLSIVSFNRSMAIPTQRFGAKLDAQGMVEAFGRMERSNVPALAGITPAQMMKIPGDCWFEYDNREVKADIHPTDMVEQILKNLQGKSPDAFGCIWMHYKNADIPLGLLPRKLVHKGRTIDADRLNTLELARLVLDADAIEGNDCFFPHERMPAYCRLQCVRLKENGDTFIFVYPNPTRAHHPQFSPPSKPSSN